MKAIVQISLDIISIPEALETARLAMRSGVDWLEAGTPLIIAEGMNGVRALRGEFPNVPIVADLKTMDGGWLEAEIMAKAGATHVVVMERAHPETIKMVVKAGKDLGRQGHGRQPRRERQGRGCKAIWKIWVAILSSTILVTMNVEALLRRESRVRAHSISCAKSLPLCSSCPGCRWPFNRTSYPNARIWCASRSSGCSSHN